MGCNCGNQPISKGYPVNQQGVALMDSQVWIRLEFKQDANVTDWSVEVNGRQYRGGKTANRFVDVREEDYKALVATGYWKVIRPPEFVAKDVELAKSDQPKTDIPSEYLSTWPKAGEDQKAKKL